MVSAMTTSRVVQLRVLGGSLRCFLLSVRQEQKSKYWRSQENFGDDLRLASIPSKEVAVYPSE